MYSFSTHQHIIDLAGIQLGGQPGFNPTVLFAGIFFKGAPNPDQAHNHITTMLKLSATHNVPCIPDFFIRKEQYIDAVLTTITKSLPPTHPFSVDIIDPSIKIQVLERLDQEHLLQRTIYNSLHIGVTKPEVEALQMHTPAAAILVAFNPKDSSPDGKIEVLENGAHLTEKGLLAYAHDIGINNILIDTAALAPGENSGAAIAAIPVIKEEYGLPAGCAIHNVVEKSVWLTDNRVTKKVVDAASNLNIPVFGGDFAIFGPIENAEYVIPLIAWEDILISEYTENYFGVIPNTIHPRRKLG